LAVGQREEFVLRYKYETAWAGQALRDVTALGIHRQWYKMELERILGPAWWP
jgi:hypothetical protein